MKINGLKVVDGTKRITLHITERDVARGNTKDPSACAAALACLRETPCTEARVYRGRTYLKTGVKWVRYFTPQSLNYEIIAFDRGGQFEPGDYTLHPPHPSAKLGMAQGSSRNKTKAKHLQKKRAPHHHVTGVRQYGANR